VTQAATARQLRVMNILWRNTHQTLLHKICGKRRSCWPFNDNSMQTWISSFDDTGGIFKGSGPGSYTRSHTQQIQLKDRAIAILTQ